MNADDFRRRVEAINVWKSGDQRAPHKPLLLLWALGRCLRREPRLVPYEEVDEKLRELLEDFGPPRAQHHPEYPFWRLENDGLWRIEGPMADRVRERATDPSRRVLIEHEIAGGFPPALQEALEADPALVGELAHLVLDGHFPRSIHDDVLSAVGLEAEAPLRLRPERVRDPRFRVRVMVAYEYRCGVCAFHVRLANTLIGLEAAHIKWHQAGGPDVESNGIALCSLHHKLFDRGAFTVSPGLELRVSELVNGAEGLDAWLLRFHGKGLRGPQRARHRPEARFLEWHAREVFRGPARGA